MTDKYNNWIEPQQQDVNKTFPGSKVKYRHNVYTDSVLATKSPTSLLLELQARVIVPCTKLIQSLHCITSAFLCCDNLIVVSYHLFLDSQSVSSSLLASLGSFLKVVLGNKHVTPCLPAYVTLSLSLCKPIRWGDRGSMMCIMHCYSAKPTYPTLVYKKYNSMLALETLHFVGHLTT